MSFAQHLCKKGAPRRPPHSSPLISTPALNHMQKKELAHSITLLSRLKSYVTS